MARKQLPPRLELRGSVYRIIDGEKRISTWVESIEEAQACLDRYIAGKSSLLPEERTVSELLKHYSASKLATKKQRAGSKVAVIARDNGCSLDEIERRQQLAEQSIDQLTSTHFHIAHLKRILGNLLVITVNNGVVRHYAQERRAERRRMADVAKQTGKTIIGGGVLADATIVRDLIVLKAAINWANNEDPRGWFGSFGKPSFSMPVSTVSSQRLRYCTKEEASILIESAHLPHIKTFLMIGFATGARKKAIEELTWDMVNFDSGIINFGDVEHKKMRPQIGMTPALKAHLAALKAVCTTNYVIEYNGRRAGDVKNGVSSAAERAGLPWFTPHIMKHSFVTWLANDGHDIEKIANLVNTTAPTLRAHYRHLFGTLDASTVRTLTIGP